MKENKNPLFSIVIPTYNHGHLIKRCLDGLIAQTYANWEAIVVNNFSVDNTERVVSSYRDERIKLINFANGGIIARARNRAIQESKGDWLCFLDSDDWWESDKLESCLPYLDDYDLIYHNLRVVSDKGEGRKLKLWMIDPSLFVDQFFTRGNPIPNSSVVLRKEIQEKIGMINENKELVGVEDADYWLRVSFVTDRIHYIDHCLGYYWVGNNISASPKQVERQKKLYELYNAKISSKALGKAAVFLSFSCARILQMNGDAGAAKYYLEIIKSRKNLEYCFKSILGLLLLKINKNAD